MKILVCALALALVVAAPAAADEIVGTWCDTDGRVNLGADRIMVVRHRDNGTFDLLSEMPNHGSYTMRLRPLGHQSWFIIDTGTDRIQITASGNLAMYDDQGFIRTARRIPDGAALASCIRPQ